MELHVSLACAVPNGRYVEYIPQLDELTTQGMTVVDGMAVAPINRGSASPGIGTQSAGAASRNSTKQSRLEEARRCSAWAW